MTFETDSLLLVDFTSKVKDGEVFDTTYEEEAKKHSLHDPNAQYGSRLISIGNNSFPVLSGFDEALAASEQGAKLTIEVEPAKGFGKRDSGKVRMIPLRKLGDDADKASVGDTIEIDGKKGIIRYIGSGRVQIDYNHRFAGKTIIYEAHIKQQLLKDDEKIKGIIEQRIDKNSTFTLNGTKVDVNIPEEILRADGLQMVKYLTQMDVFKFVPSLESISFVETHKNKKLTPKEVTTTEPEKPKEDTTTEPEKPTAENS